MSATTSTPAHSADGLALPDRAIAVFAITLAAVLSVLDGSMLNVALPHVALETGMTPAGSVWLLNAYQLTIVASLLPLAMVGERLGYARLFRLGVLLFTASALACAVAPNAPSLVIARVTQGLGSGCIMSCAAALLRATYPARMFTTGLGINTMAVTLASASGPAVSSAILAVADWRWLFALSLPAGAVAWACAHKLPSTPRQQRRMDPASVLLNVAAMSLTIVGLDQLGHRPWVGLALLCVAAATWRTWVRRDALQATPLLPLDLFELPRFRFAILTSVMMFAAQMTSLVALPFYFHDTRGLGLVQSAMLLTTWPISATATTAFASRLLPRHGAAKLCAAGATSMACGLLWILGVPPGMHYAVLAPGLLLGGVAVGLFQAPNTHDMLSAPPRARSGAAGSMQAIARVGGQTLGATLTAIGLASSARHGPTIALSTAIVVAMSVLVVSLKRKGLSG